ncbi:FlgO family outer membrane protein [Shewanella sp. VB17]|uniref:FlgO family outer membrane protein n=1 Tax=Shewanella sp. VB17 TaxID=2739432 RepID=UPI0020B8A1E1|nr:FlgO family outer membrane protein [Shewanella sp. VB17]
MKPIISFVVISLLTSCSMFNDTTSAQDTELTTNMSVNDRGNFRFNNTLNAEDMKVDSFEGRELNNDINFYIRGMMQDLVGNLQYVNNTTPIAVTSFAFLDSDLQQTNLLGNQIAESLIHEIHKVGIPVLDFKITDSLSITQEGDFISSRGFNDLTAEIPIKYIVTGNLVKHQGGYLVNARIVGISSKAVVASAQSFIPAHVAKALLSSKPVSSSEQGVKKVPLVQG